ncbi:MAG: hypothetical protein HUU34_16490 [Saprospiraceae bacterium]|jgi:hypothetical protein|nr:hypothetical protein [Saprospiraceae bacterium]
MKNTKLVALLKKLSTRERSKLRELVFSPFFNKNEKIQRLCAWLLPFAPAFDSDQLEKTIAFPRVFGETTSYDELAMNNAISDLLHLAYDFLAWQQYRLRPQLRQDLLLTELLEREMLEQVDRNVARFQQLQQKTRLRNADYYYADYQYYDKQDRYALGQTRRYDESLQKKSDALDTFYVIDKLRMACDMVSRNTVVNAGYECHFLDEILGYCRENRLQLSSIPAVQVYLHTLQLLQEHQEEPYRQWKDMLDAAAHLFPADELRTLYNYGLNYCVKKINSGQTAFYRDILDLYRVLLTQKIIFKNGYLTQWSFINIATAGIRLKEFDWTASFIENFQHDLWPEDRHNVYHFCLASLYFEKKEFQRALQMLQAVAFNDAYYHLSAKIIQLKSYFELQETEPFFSLLEATRLYLSRNLQLSDYQKNSNVNFFKLAAKLYQLNLQAPRLTAAAKENRRQEIALLIDRTSPLANKDWLVQRLERL